MKTHVMIPALLITATLIAGCEGSGTSTDEFQALLATFGNLTTVAGTGNISEKNVSGWQASMEGASALDAELSRPHMAMADSAGNIFIADMDAHAIRKVTPLGAIHTVAGMNVAGDGGEGQGTQTRLDSPNGLYVLPNGTVYILDLGNNKIRKLSPSGQITTVLQDTDGIVAGRGLWVSDDETTIYYSSWTRVMKWQSGPGLTEYASGFTQLANLDIGSDGNCTVPPSFLGVSLFPLPLLKGQLSPPGPCHNTPSWRYIPCLSQGPLNGMVSSRLHGDLCQARLPLLFASYMRARFER